MGFLSKVFDSVSGAAGKTANNVLGGGGTNAPKPEVDPRLKELSAEQTKQAEQFKQNLPAYKEEQYNISSDQLKKQFANQDVNINRNANQRGLLYSGLNQGAHAQNQANLAGSLSQSRAQINQSAEEQARNLDLAAISAGQAAQGIEQGNNLMAYQQAMDQYQQKKQGMGMIGGLLGMGAGAFVGGPTGAMVGGQAGSAIGGGMY